MSGSGSLSVNAKGPTTAFTNLRSVPGLGTIQHRCMGPGDIEIRLDNTTGGDVQISWSNHASGDSGANIVGAGGTQGSQILTLEGDGGSTIDSATIHLQKLKGLGSDPKRPQAEVTVTGGAPGGNCTGGQLFTSAIALSSQS